MKNPGEKHVIIIAIITAACILGDSMLFIVMPIYWQDFGLVALWQVGILLSANRLIRLPINPLVGWFYKHMDKRTGVVLAILLAASSTLAYGWLKGFWVLLIMRCLWGVAWSLLRLGGFLTVIEVADDSSRGRLMGKYNGLWGLGSLTGMLVGGLLADLTNVELVATLFGIISIASLPIAMKYVPNTKETSDPVTTSGIQKDQSFWKNRDAWAVLLTGLVMAMVIFGVFFSTLSRLLEINLSQTEIIIGAATLAGILQALKWACDPFLAPLVGKLSDEKFGRTNLLIFVFFISSILFFMFTVQVSLTLLIITLLIFQLMTTTLVTVTDALASDVASKTSKVGLMTVYTIAVDLGAAVGPLVGYVIVDFISLNALYQITAVILSLIGLFWLVIKIRSTQPS